MGTPEFAVPSLRALVAGPYMVAVVTQPDRPAGRGGKLTPSPVKVVAQELGLTLLQPESLKDPEFRAKMAALRPEATVLVAYGEYVSPTLLDLPRHGSLNLHPSLLPRWRGSTPVQSAILAGDKETGVSIILMDKGLDTGPILAQRKVGIGAEENTPELGARLANVGAALLEETLPRWLRGEIQPQPQPEEGATLTRSLRKEDGAIDWTMPAEQIDRRIRALQPWPGTYTYWGERLLKILRARQAKLPGGVQIKPPGEVQLLATEATDALVVWTGRGAIELLDVQFAGKAKIGARALLSGYPQIIGSSLRSDKST